MEGKDIDMELRVLGPVEIYNGHKLAIGGPRQRRIVAVLAANAGEVVSLDRLVDLTWEGEELPGQAERNIRTYVSRIRHAMGDLGGRLETVAPGYLLAIDAEEFDARRFEDGCARAGRLREQGDDAGALAEVDSALALWRGRPYAEFADESWVQADAARLAEARFGALVLKAGILIDEGRSAEALIIADALIDEQPIREEPRAVQMRALHELGRGPEALRAFQDFRAHLIDEVGVNPSADLVELDRAIARGDVPVAGRSAHVRGYELHELIGTGAFAEVHRGVQPTLRRDVAVKSVRADLANRPEFIRGFEAEASMIARLEHPHIVPLYDFWREPDKAYLVMRWLTGGSLESSLDHGPWSVEDTATMVEQVGSALALAHRAGVVHRDVKSANILLDDEGNAYLTDFGIAVDAEGVENPAAVLSEGSPAYAAPEQLRRQAVGPTADVFGLAIAVYETLVGRLPFHDASDRTELLRRQLEEPLPPASASRPELSAAVDEVLAKATAKRPADRYQDVGSFAEALLQALADSPAASVPVREAAARVTAVAAAVDNPYRGLAAFAEGDERVFHGRDRLVDELCARLQEAPGGRGFLAVVGPSGSGKSSVVRAGLVPALRDGRVRGSEQWFLTTMTPGPRPFEALETALLRVAVNPPASLLGQLCEDVRGIIRSVRRVLPTDDATAVVVIDQFEELFTLCADDDMRSRFLDALATAVTDPSRALRVVVTLRADFFDEPLRHRAVADLFKHQSVTITPLAPDELEQSIVRPAAGVGVDFEPGLVARIMADVASQPGGLPLMQYALTELFDARAGAVLTSASYEEMHGLSGALARRAETLFESFDADQRVAARRLFGRLVTLGEGTEDTRRRVQRSEVAGGAATERVIDAFGRARLLAFDRDPASREPTIEVAHEALIREWPRLRTWLAEDRELLRVLRTVTDAARQWDGGGRDEADLIRGGRLEAALELRDRAPRELNDTEREFIEASAEADREREAARRRVTVRLRRQLVGVGVFAVLALAAGVVALLQRSSAVEARDDAQLAEYAAETRRLAADAPQVVETSHDLGLLLAAEAYRREPGPETLGALWRVLVKTDEFLGLVGAGNDYRRVEWSPDGTVVYALRAEGVDALAVDGTEARVVYQGDTAPALAASPDGARLAVATLGDEVRVVDLETGRADIALRLDALARTLAFLPDGRRLVTGDQDGWLSVWDVEAGTLLGRVHAHPESQPSDLPPELRPPGDLIHEPLELQVGVGAVTVLPDGEDVLTSGSVFVRRWRLDDLEMTMETGVTRRDIANSRRVPGTPGEMVLAPDAQRVFVPVELVVQVIDVDSGELLDELSPGIVAIAPDNFDIAMGDRLAVLLPGVLTTIDPDTLEDAGRIKIGSLRANLERPDVAVSPDGRMAATVSGPGVRLFALDGTTLVSRSVEAPGSARALQVTGDGRHVMSTALGSVPVLLDLDSRSPAPVAVGVDDAFWGHLDVFDTPVAWRVTSGGRLTGVGFDPVMGEPNGITWGPLTFSAGAQSPDKRMMAVGGALPERPVGVQVFDTTSGEPVSPKLTQGDAIWQVASLAWSPDGGRLVAVFDNGPTVVYNTDTWEQERVVAPSGQRHVGAAFSPDGRYLVFTDFFGRLSVRDALTYQPIGVELQAGTGGPGAEGLRRLEFTADGRYLVVAHPELQIIDVATWTPVGDAVVSDPGEVGFRASLPRGAEFAATILDGRVRVWTLAPDTWSELACRAAGRNMTRSEWEQFGPASSPYEATCPQWPIESAADFISDATGE